MSSTRTVRYTCTTRDYVPCTGTKHHQQLQERTGIKTSCRTHGPTERRKGPDAQTERGAGKLDLAWLRTPKYHFDLKYSFSCLEEYFDPKYSSAGRIRAFFARLIFWPVFFSENLPRKKPFFFRRLFLSPPPIFFKKSYP